MTQDTAQYRLSNQAPLIEVKGLSKSFNQSDRQIC